MTRNFAEFEPLSPTEKELLANLGREAIFRCGDGTLPPEGNDGPVLRAELLRMLLLGGADVPKRHEKGLVLSGTRIVGLLDLESCRIPRDLCLLNCRFDSPLVLRSAIVDTLQLDGSAFPGLEATRLQARGSAYLRGVGVDGGIDLKGAQLGGDLVLDGATVVQDRGVAFDGSHISMRGDMTLRAALIRGAIDVSGARLGGDLNLNGIDLQYSEDPVLDAKGVQVQGNVSLAGARVAGEVNLTGARVVGDFHLNGGIFTATKDLAVVLNRAVIEGAFFLRDGAKVTGGLSLAGTRVELIVDEKECWPAPGDLLLNRFTYKGFLASPVDAASRLDWLSRQDPARWGERFWPQPYEQLSVVLSAMGHHDDARAVQLEKERLQRRLRKARARSPLARLAYAAGDGLLWVTVGYGLRPLLAFVWIILLWLMGVGLLAAVQAKGELRPNVAVFLRSPEWVLCADTPDQQVRLSSADAVRRGLAAPLQSQLECFLAQPESQSYPKFNKWIYSLETMIPGMDSGQRTYWSPDTRFDLGYATKLFEYFQIVIGFALGLLAFAGFSGIVKSR